MKILVINAGSSSIKYRLFDMVDEAALAGGIIERIGEASGLLTHKVYKSGAQAPGISREREVEDHRRGMDIIIELLTAADTGVIAEASEIDAVGHRVVHGGETFKEPALIDDDVLVAVRDNVPLAPLHNPANLAGIEVARAVFPDTAQVAVFDTAFHQTLPMGAYVYALPGEFYRRHRIRRYGFHGTSHQYVANKAAELVRMELRYMNVITVHLGNGCSMAAVEGGRCIDTSMGMTPLEGLVMGTRSGDIDPAIIFHLNHELGMALPEINKLLNNESGLKAFTGVNDMREVEKRMDQGDAAAALAFEVFTYRIKKYIGAYYAALGGVDAIVFTAGIGENSPRVRERVCKGLERLGITIDPDKNRASETGPREIQADGGEVRVMVIPTNEELEIARQTREVVAK
jgi:acetate kinase